MSAARALVAQALGDRVAAQAALGELLQHDSAGGAYQIAQVYALRGERDAALAWLERGYRQHDAGLWTMRVDPRFAGLAKEPRFIALRPRMNPDT